MSDTPSRCMYALCAMPPKGLVRMQVYTKPEASTPDIREVPMCQPCSDEVAGAFKRGTRLHMTPGGAIYFGNLDQLLPGRKGRAA